MSHSVPVSPFVPMRLLDFVSDDSCAAAIPCAVLLADLSNFTGLTEALAERAGTDGGELVGRDLNLALGPVIDAVMSRGGEVLKFSGDGLLCLFPGDAAAVDAAQQAARNIALVVVRGPVGELHHFRISIVHGDVCFLRLGGYQGRHELVAGGPAVEQAQRLLPDAAPGMPAPATLLLPSPSPSPVALAGRARSHSDPFAYLPAYVRARLTEHQTEWLQELRTLTLLFVAIDSELGVSAFGGPARAIQEAVEAQGGQLLRFSFEGPTLVAEVAFGLAVGAVATGPHEAMQCAMTMCRDVQGARAGISTGRVLLGPVGSAVRRQLTTLGSPVNLAARLMQRAKAGQALADEATFSAAGGCFHGLRQEEEFKGLGKRAFWRLHSALGRRTAVDQGIVGRDQERSAIRDLLDRAETPLRPLLIQGEAGVGKSRVCRWLAAELQARGITALLAVATPIGRDLPYAGLAQVVSELCGLSPGMDPVPALRSSAGHVLGDPDRAPLLGDALGLVIPDGAATRALTGRARAENILEALMTLLRHRQADGHAALLIEDAHWLDSASWALLHRLVQDGGSPRLVVSSRPMLGLEPPELGAIRACGALVLDLQPLSAQDIESVVARRMETSAVPAALSKWVGERARGNPFFAEELVSMLLADGHIEVRAGVCTRTPDAAALQAMPPLATIERTLEQRIDRLPVEDAVLLKVASVIGPTFGLDELSDLTTPGGDGVVQAAVQRLVAAEMASPAGPGRFAFRHRYTQEAAYRMLPGHRRRELHGRVAQWVELRMGGRAEERAGELAHHWFAADNRPQAVRWLETAGRQALRTGADREAATQFSRALSIGEAEPAGRRAAWHRQHARALFGLGEVEGVAAQARMSVELVARPLPVRPSQWAWLSGRIVLGRLSGVRATRRGRLAQPEDLLEGARAAGLLAESAYFLNAPEMMVCSALLAVDLAERTPDAAPVSVAYGMLGVLAGMARLHGTARRYLKRARELAERADEPYQLGVAWFYSGMYFACLGEWEASLDATQRALALTEELGADMQSGFELTLIATNALYTSEYTMTRQWMETVRLRAKRSANVQQLGWACNVVSVADLHQGHFSAAIELSGQAREIFQVQRDLVSLIIAEGVHCAALCRAGRMAEALASADRASALMTGARPTTWGQLEGFSGPCEVYAMAVAQLRLDPEATRRRARLALARLRMFALVFPFGRARYHWIRGLFALSCGEPKAAGRRFRRALELARCFRMPFEEMRAAESLAQLVDSGGRTVLLERATEVKRSFGTPP